MKNKYSQIKTLAAIAGLALTATSVNAALLAIDFNHNTSPTESGFIGQNSSSVVHSTTAGNLTVSYSGQQGTFDRGVGATATHGTNTDLYRDFIFDNSTTMVLTLSGPALSANTAYELTFYAFDEAQDSSVSFAGTSGTAGSVGPIVSTADADITSLGQFAATGTFISDGAGILTITTGAGTRPRINGFSIIPEPSTTALLGLGGLALILRRRK